MDFDNGIMMENFCPSLPLQKTSPSTMSILAAILIQLRASLSCDLERSNGLDCTLQTSPLSPLTSHVDTFSRNNVICSTLTTATNSPAERFPSESLPSFRIVRLCRVVACMEFSQTRNSPLSLILITISSYKLSNYFMFRPTQFNSEQRQIAISFIHKVFVSVSANHHHAQNESRWLLTMKLQNKFQ